MGQVKWHVHPVAAHIYRHFNAIEQRQQVAVLPPGIAEWVLCGNGAPEIIPWMRVVVKFQQDLEASDCGFAVGHLELLMDAWSEQNCPNCVNQLAAPELIGMAGGHADHEEKGSKKATAHHTVVGRRLIKIEGSCDGHDVPFTYSAVWARHRVGAPDDADHQITLLKPARWVRFQNAAKGFVAKYETCLTGRCPPIFPFDNLDVGTTNPDRDGLYEYRAFANIRLLDFFPLGSAALFGFDGDRSHLSDLILGLHLRQYRACAAATSWDRRS